MPMHLSNIATVEQTSHDDEQCSSGDLPHLQEVVPLSASLTDANIILLGVAFILLQLMIAFLLCPTNTTKLFWIFLKPIFKWATDDHYHAFDSMPSPCTRDVPPRPILKMNSTNPDRTVVEDILKELSGALIVSEDDEHSHRLKKRRRRLRKKLSDFLEKDKNVENHKDRYHRSHHHHHVHHHRKASQMRLRSSKSRSLQFEQNFKNNDDMSSTKSKHNSKSSASEEPQLKSKRTLSKKLKIRHRRSSADPVPISVQLQVVERAADLWSQMTKGRRFSDEDVVNRTKSQGFSLGEPQPSIVQAAHDHFPVVSFSTQPTRVFETFAPNEYDRHSVPVTYAFLIKRILCRGIPLRANYLQIQEDNISDSSGSEQQMHNSPLNDDHNAPSNVTEASSSSSPDSSPKAIKRTEEESTMRKDLGYPSPSDIQTEKSTTADTRVYLGETSSVCTQLNKPCRKITHHGEIPKKTMTQQSQHFSMIRNDAQRIAINVDSQCNQPLNEQENVPVFLRCGYPEYCPKTQNGTSEEFKFEMAERGRGLQPHTRSRFSRQLQKHSSPMMRKDSQWEINSNGRRFAVGSENGGDDISCGNFRKDSGHNDENARMDNHLLKAPVLPTAVSSLSPSPCRSSSLSPWKNGRFSHQRNHSIDSLLLNLRKDTPELPLEDISKLQVFQCDQNPERRELLKRKWNELLVEKQRRRQFVEVCRRATLDRIKQPSHDSPHRAVSLEPRPTPRGYSSLRALNRSSNRQSESKSCAPSHRNSHRGCVSTQRSRTYKDKFGNSTSSFHSNHHKNRNRNDAGTTTDYSSHRCDELHRTP